MKLYFAAVLLAVFATSSLHSEETGPNLGTTEQKTGYRPRSSGIQALSVSSYTYGNPSNFEQLMLELVNRSRANPGAEAQRLGISLNQNLPAGTISNTPKPPLAFHQTLINSARAHSQWMLDNDIFSHTGVSGTSSTQRMESAGYPFSGQWGSGENIAWRGISTTINPDQYTRILHDDLFKSSVHREAIMDARFDQVGVGVVEGLFKEGATNWKALMATQNFAFSAGSPSPSGPLVLGVAYKDNNSNNAYDPGEGLGGVTVNLLPGDTTTTTSSSGGYAIPMGTTSGSLILTFSGGSVPQPTQVTATAMPDINIKVDLVVSGTGTPSSTVATPAISPNGGSFGRSVKVKLTCATAGATIRFTTTGAEPTASSTKYSTAITLKKSATVKAKAFKTGSTDSATATAVFTKN